MWHICFLWRSDTQKKVERRRPHCHTGGNRNIYKANKLDCVGAAQKAKRDFDIYARWWSVLTASKPDTITWSSFIICHISDAVFHNNHYPGSPCWSLKSVVQKRKLIRVNLREVKHLTHSSLPSASIRPKGTSQLFRLMWFDAFLLARVPGEWPLAA